MIDAKLERIRYTRNEAALYLSEQLCISLKPKTLSQWGWKKNRELKFIKDGHSVYYRKTDLDAYIENRLKQMFMP